MIDVALDARLTRRMSAGTRAYVRELLARLPRIAPDLDVREVGVGEHFGLVEQVGLPYALLRLRPRLAHFMTPLAPALRPVPYVVTVHDLIHLRLPQLFSRATALYYATLGRSLIRGAARICVTDERNASDVERFFSGTHERCRVVPLGYDPALLAEQDAESGPRPYLLYVGNHRPHKNLPALFSAFAALPSTLDLDLYVTGPDDFSTSLDRCARANGRIVALGEVERARLWRLYRGALAYVQPSLAEGFGIPMLEAAVVGTPVIASLEAVPSILAEVAWTFPAHDVGSLEAFLLAVALDPEPFRTRAREAAPALRAYTWDRFAAGTAEVYRETLRSMA